jgi:type I restriction enzyme R subunit
MNNTRQDPAPFLRIDLPDFMAGKGYVLVGPTGEQMYVETYRKLVEERILSIAEAHPALSAIREGREPTRDQLIDLEHVLKSQLTATDVGLSPKAARQAYQANLDGPEGFLGFASRILDIVGLPDYRSVVTKAFEEHIARHRYTGDQLRFMRAVEDVFLRQRRLLEGDLY